ncbi:MAG: response regulator [Proteobacteria bacterium]|nr:response regulator [Pseudomonadota bacterium]
MKFSDLVNIDELRGLCESYTSVTGAVTALLDLEGTVLVSTGWQDLCTRFHRINNATAARCHESDTILAGGLGNGVSYNIYKCKNGLVDVAVPIMIRGEHVANFFTGQFFTEAPDREFFIRQAEEFGFDEKSYLEALKRVPVFPEGTIKSMMNFFTRLAQMIGEMGLVRKELLDSNDKLLQNRNVLTHIMNSIPQSIFWKDRESVYVGCNRVFARLAGFDDSDDIIGKSDFNLPWSQEETEGYRADDREVMDNVRPKYHIIETQRQSNGKATWIDTTKIPLIDVSGAVIGVLGVYEDITERRLVEQEKQELEQQLLHSQKLESLGVLAGGIAHDFNNILAVIFGHCSLAELRPETVDTHIPVIKKAAERAADLCRQMLAYAGKAQIVQTQIDMGTLVDEMVKMLKATITKNVNIKCDLLPDIPFIKGDASQIRQVVMNLIINAAEAVGAAQGEIHVTVATAVIRAGQTEKDHFGKVIPAGWYVCLEVTDNGCGMDAETRQRIFEPFYTTKITGRGLGMSAVLGIIKPHRGALQLSSQTGQGTTFKLYLPVQVSDATGDESLQQGSSKPWQGNGTILLVEDEKEVRFVAKIMLNEMGFTVIEASNGKEALELYQKNAEKITLVMTDMGMPVIDGYELFDKLKILDPCLPIIISTGFGDTAVTTRIAREYIAGLVSKPYDFDQLQKVLKGVVEDVRQNNA